MNILNQIFQKQIAKNVLIFSALVLVSSIRVFAQESEGEIIKRALRDEMKRSMDSLEFRDFSKPYFIAYRFDQNKSLNISATLGALTSSNVSESNNTAVRLMVGDYQLNDENFSSYSSFNNGLSSFLPTPLDVDYYAIRRAFWVSTDAVYKSAGEIYKTKLQVLEKHGISKEDYLIPDFAKAPVVKREIPQPEIKFEKEKWEELARKASAIFLDYPDIVSSGFSVSVYSGRNYYINNEGTEVVQPVTVSSISVYASADIESGPEVSDFFHIYVDDPNDFPGEDELMKKTKGFADHLMELKSAPVFDDIYTGPVLFVGDASASLFRKALFGYSGLKARREEMSGSANVISIPDKPDVNSIEAKIGKKVISRDLSVLALPKLKTYRGQNLLGSFEIDGEGVIPPDTLVLVKDGILETLLNGRTPSILVRESNGHNRLGSSGMGISRSVGPGVVEVVASKTSTREELMNQMFGLAEEEDLEYVFIVKRIGDGGYQNLAEVYKVNIADGTEELVRGVGLSGINLKLLKKVEGVSDSIMLSNSSSSQSYMGGSLSSFIVPDATLIKEIEIEGTTTSSTNKLPVVKNPLLK
jgi:predicted Zn-dependent protease